MSKPERRGSEGEDCAQAKLAIPTPMPQIAPIAERASNLTRGCSALCNQITSKATVSVCSKLLSPVQVKRKLPLVVATV